MATSQSSTKTEVSRTNHGTRIAEKPKFHWIYCHCKDSVNCIQDSQDPKTITGVEELEESCSSCSHSRCNQCEVVKDRGIDEKGIASNNLLDKLKAEYQHSPVQDRKRYIWECYYCRQGPHAIGGPGRAQDKD